jgi:hypothetical protein
LNAESALVYDWMFDDQKRAKWAPGRFVPGKSTPNKVVRLLSAKGMKVTIHFTVKPNDKTVVAIEVAKLPSFESVPLTKETWRLALEKLAALCKSPK